MLISLSKLYDTVIELDPKYASAYHNRGNAYKILGNHEKGNKDLQKAKEIGLDTDKIIKELDNKNKEKDKEKEE